MAPVPSVLLLCTGDALLKDLIVSIQNPCKFGNRSFGKGGDSRRSRFSTYL